MTNVVVSIFSVFIPVQWEPPTTFRFLPVQTGLKGKVVGGSQTGGGVPLHRYIPGFKSGKNRFIPVKTSLWRKSGGGGLPMHRYKFTT